MFHIVRLTEDELRILVSSIQRCRSNTERLILGYDELDQSIQFRTEYGSWSPPMITVERR